MLEKVIQKVINDMLPFMGDEQLEHLANSLYVNFHGLALVQECTGLVPAGDNGDEVKIKMFVASKRAVNRQANTLMQYTREIRNLLDFLGKRIDDITAMDIRYYFGVMRERRGISMSTLQTRLHYLNSFWEFLISEELVAKNPVKKVGMLKVEKTIKKPFSDTELEALRVNCRNVRDRALVEFLYSTGVRVSELVNLNIKDIDMEKQELIVYGKGSKERITYLSDVSKFYLRRYLESRIEDGLGNQPLFVGLKKPHGRLTKAGVQYMLKQLGKRAHVDDCHPHRFRRTIATNLLSRNMKIEEVKEFLGHERLDTTLVYCTINQENVKTSHRKCA